MLKLKAERRRLHAAILIQSGKYMQLCGSYSGELSVCV